MSDQFNLSGSYQTQPLGGISSGNPTLVAPINESMILTEKSLDTLMLTVDTPVAVSFGGVTNANAIVMRAVGGPVTVRLTSAAGATQSVPMDEYFSVLTSTVPVTAIDLTRSPGVLTTVTVFLGQKA